MKIRELATLYADDSHTVEQKQEFSDEMKSIYNQLINMRDNLEFNGMTMFV